ncbi:MAG: Uma2 family endonuclease [Defluviitaleaceae bacterium]|nr:Uma2 family endonuclease [Defluviitaleaceae bacterium]
MNITYDDLMTYEEDEREEILDGKIVKLEPSATAGHNRVGVRLINKFSNNPTGCEVFYETDVILSKKDRVRPDIIVVCDQNKIDSNGWVHGAPDLIVEILSPSTSGRDKKYKKKLYEKHGVHEYWIVDIKAKRVEVFLLTDGRYELDALYEAHTDQEIEIMTESTRAEKVYKFTTHLWEDVTIDVYEIFKGW